MDPSKKKKVPPVPKFQITKQQKNTLKEKLDEFMMSLTDKKQQSDQKIVKNISNPNQINEKKNQQKSNLLKSPVNQPAQPQKKKLNISNINSKLATMMNLKKDLLNKAKGPQEKSLESSSNKIKQQIKRKIDIQLEYDPTTPNIYEFVKSFYDTPKIQQKKDFQEIKIKSQQQMQIQQVTQQSTVLEQTQEKALKMMQKYGFKVGQGLGKNNQGITTPLTIKKTTDSSCIITQSSIPLNELIKPEISAKSALQAFNISQTRVLVLNNIVNIKQLDEQVQNEIRQQCQKYSKIIDWIVYLIGGELRIFLKMQSVEGAFNTFVKLNDKYFNSNLISVRFYNEKLFQSFKLDEPLHQHISF